MSSSNVVLSADRVRKLADAKIQSIKLWRQEQEKALIEIIVKQRNAGFWHRLLKRKDVTYEDVLGKLERELEDDGSPFATLWSVRGLGQKWFNLAVDFKVAAGAVSGDSEMVITIEDLNHLL